jgi:hypothetical protein
MLRLNWKVPSLKRALLLGAASFVGIAGVATAVAIFAPLVVGVVVGAVVGAPLSVLFMFRSGPLGTIGPSSGIAAAAISCFLVSPPVKTLRGERAVGIRVEDARAHPQATIFSFKDAVLRPDFRGTHEVSTRKRRWKLHAVPVVPDGWSPRTPVHVWACSRSETGDGAWNAPHRQGYRMKELDEDACRDAVADVVQRAKLTTAADAPIIVWSSNPEEEARSDLVLGVVVTAIPFVLFFVGLPIAYPHLKKRRGPGDRPRGPSNPAA